jgi:hypothetical protein
MAFFLFLIISLWCKLVLPLKSIDDWNKVGGLNLVRELNECAQPCVQFVNEKVFFPEADIHCQTYGCVCAEGTQGQHFLYSLSNVTECVKDACGNDEDVQAARASFQDLCLVYVANQTQPTEKPGSSCQKINNMYSNYFHRDKRHSNHLKGLSERPLYCIKFALNGCLDKDGARTWNVEHCEPINKLDNWEDYRGVAAQRKCEDAECLCKRPRFNTTLAVANKAAEEYCNIFVSSEGLENTNWEEMVNVIATYCAAAQNPPRAWRLEVTGVLMAHMVSNTPTPTPNPNNTNENGPKDNGTETNNGTENRPSGGKSLQYYNAVNPNNKCRLVKRGLDSNWFWCWNWCPWTDSHCTVCLFLMESMGLGTKTRTSYIIGRKCSVLPPSNTLHSHSFFRSHFDKGS